MGIDFLDMVFQIEKKHGLYLQHFFEDRFAVEEFRRAGEMVPSRTFFGRPVERWDIRAGRFFEFLRPRLEPLCKKCKALLRGPPGSGSCAQCGRTYEWTKLSWESFQEILSGMLNTTPSQVRPDAWLVGDLDFDSFGSGPTFR